MNLFHYLYYIYTEPQSTAQSDGSGASRTVTAQTFVWPKNCRIVGHQVKVVWTRCVCILVVDLPGSSRDLAGNTTHQLMMPSIPTWIVQACANSLGRSSVAFFEPTRERPFFEHLSSSMSKFEMEAFLVASCR